MVTANELWLSTTSATVSVSISVSVTFRSLMAFSQLRSAGQTKDSNNELVRVPKHTKETHYAA